MRARCWRKGVRNKTGAYNGWLKEGGYSYVISALAEAHYERYPPF